MKKFVFLSGLPRTGSTVLGTLLSQHPDLHTTSTSVVRNLMSKVFDLHLGQSLYFDRFDDASPMWGILRGILNGAYEHCSEPVIVDKDRGWAEHIEITEKVLRYSPKIVSPVRSIPDILASFVLIANKIGSTSKIHEEVIEAGREVNSWSLTRVIWEKYVYEDWRNFKAGYESHPQCFHLIEYDDLVNHSEESLEKVLRFFGVFSTKFETEHLRNPHPENDAIYGLPGLHQVQPKLVKHSPCAIETLGEECFAFWQSQNLEFWRG